MAISSGNPIKTDININRKMFFPSPYQILVNYNAAPLIKVHCQKPQWASPTRNPTSRQRTQTGQMQ